MVLAALLSGMGIEVMRAEQQRLSLQDGVDDCVLVAATQRQSLTPQAVFDSCMSKAGLAEVAYQRNDLDAASRHVAAALPDSWLDKSPFRGLEPYRFEAAAAGIIDACMAATGVASSSARSHPPQSPNRNGSADADEALTRLSGDRSGNP